jgi:hypothetical protein
MTSIRSAHCGSSAPSVSADPNRHIRGTIVFSGDWFRNTAPSPNYQRNFPRRIGSNCRRRASRSQIPSQAIMLVDSGTSTGYGSPMRV